MRALLCPLIGLMLSGCLAPAPPEPHGELPEQASTADIAVDYDGSGCTTIGIFPWVEPEDVYPLLPPGFWPAEATREVGAPTTAGKSLLLLSWTMCDTWGDGGASASGTVAVLVDAPNVPGVAKQPGWDFYELVRITDDERLDQILRDWSWPAWEGELDMRSDLQLAGAGHARIVLELAGVPAFRADTIGALEYSMEGKTVRLWHQSERGLAVHTLVTAAVGAAGSAECRLHPGTPLADLLPEAMLVEDACGDLVNSIVFQDVDWQTQFRFMPEATAR